MKTRFSRFQRFLFIGFFCCLLFCSSLLAACGDSQATGAHPAPTPGTTALQPATQTTPAPAAAVALTPAVTETPTATVTPTTPPRPNLQTSCPATGKARPAMLLPRALGTHANIVYLTYEEQGFQIVRYDTVTKQKTILMKKPQGVILNAQISADGQWILFESPVSKRDAIQLLRMDGRELQTLYCSPGNRGLLNSLQWSPDQKKLVFNEGSKVELLTLATGVFRQVALSTTVLRYTPLTWLDNTRFYLKRIDRRDTLPERPGLFLLDTLTGNVSHILDTTTYCGDYDSSIDGKYLFLSICTFQSPTLKGPSSIRVLPAEGGKANTIYRSTTYSIVSLRVVSRHTLLFIIHNTGTSHVDHSHDGLWKINIDGTGLTRLASNGISEFSGFNSYTQYVWSTISRDGKTYVMKSEHAFLIGSVDGGEPFAVSGDVNLVGWTTLS
jgi:hypothetical protein